MTKSDWRYLLWFGGFICAFVVAMILDVWNLAILFGVFVALFTLHMTFNLMSPISRTNALSLLRKIHSSKDNNYVLDVEKWDSDYSEWDAFCDTPIINDRLLNRIRVKCHSLRDTSISYDASNKSPIEISKDAVEEIGKYIRELEEDNERRV